MTRDLPDDVVDFVYRYVESVDVLETLLRLHAEPRRTWTPSEVAQALGIPTDLASDVLAGLHFNGLASGSDTGYRFDARSATVAGNVDALVRTYRQRPAALVREIDSLGSARSFARAFDLRKRKKKNDG